MYPPLLSTYVSIAGMCSCMPLYSFCLLHYISVPGPVRLVYGFSASSTSVKLSWTPPTDRNGHITGYHIQYISESLNDTHGNREISTSSALTVNYTVTGLEENTLYHFTVSAENSAGRGEGSTVSVRTSIARESL